MSVCVLYRLREEKKPLCCRNSSYVALDTVVNLNVDNFRRMYIGRGTSTLCLKHNDLHLGNCCIAFLSAVFFSLYFLFFRC